MFTNENEVVRKLCRSDPSNLVVSFYAIPAQGFIQDFISGDVSKNRGVTDGYTRDLLTYLNAAVSSLPKI